MLRKRCLVNSPAARDLMINVSSSNHYILSCQEKTEADSSIPTDITDYIDKIDQDEDEEEVIINIIIYDI